MDRFINFLNAYFKGVVLLLRPHILFGWLSRPLLMKSNLISLSKWISQQDKTDVFNDFYSAKRDYQKRYKLYEYVISKLNLTNELFDYLEFGVSAGYSFRWWAANTVNPGNKYYGFDTFEGLPEAWGTYGKGDMSATIPTMEDQRAVFVKGLFQESLPGFLTAQTITVEKRKIIHLDADLFSSTLFALTSLAPYLKKGDILMFDEFNVPNHEFFAFKIFCDSYYIKTKLIGAVNNYYQVALIIE
ncbi:MAG: class I SAM-dependent methyltransferase [Agriterribacter sp.]